MKHESPADLSPNSCAGRLHHITGQDVPVPYRWRCVRCGGLFMIAPTSIRVDDKPAAIALRPNMKNVKFAAVDRSVMRGQEHIATAVSNTFAQRIARALNLHKPNDRGV